MTNLLRAFAHTRRSFRIVLWIYGLNAALSLLILLPAYLTLRTEMGHSMAFTGMLDGLNYTIFTDFMENSGRAINPILSVGRWLGLLWIGLSVFLAGGILLHFSQPEEPLQARIFLAGCLQYVKRFAGLLGVVALFFSILAVIVILIGTLLGAAFFESVTEQTLLYIGFGTVAILLVASSLVFCIGDYAKVLLFRTDDRNPFRAFGQAGRLVLGNLSRTFGTYLLLIVLGTFLFGLYFLADSLIGMQNWPTIILLFIIQQGFIVARIFLKVWSLGMAYDVADTLVRPLANLPVPVQQPVDEPVESAEPDTDPTLTSPAD